MTGATKHTTNKGITFSVFVVEHHKDPENNLEQLRVLAPSLKDDCIIMVHCSCIEEVRWRAELRELWCPTKFQRVAVELLTMKGQASDWVISCSS